MSAVPTPPILARGPYLDTSGRRPHARKRLIEYAPPERPPRGWEVLAAAEILGAVPGLPWSRYHEELVAAIIREHAGTGPFVDRPITQAYADEETPGPPIVCAGAFAIGNLDLQPGWQDAARVQITHADGEAGEFPAGRVNDVLEAFFWKEY